MFETALDGLNPNIIHQQKHFSRMAKRNIQFFKHKLQYFATKVQITQSRQHARSCRQQAVEAVMD